MENKVRKYIEKNRLLSEDSLILLGISGGADSVALLRVLLALGYRCVAVHCNFHLRGEESNRDQMFVEHLCASFGVKLEICHYDTYKYASDNKISIEMAARELRYADFERLRRKYNADYIAVAHHRDDSVETLLMNLMRGTGIRGLTGIKPINGNIIRPLLSLQRLEIEEYLKGIGQDYVTDSTNLEADYTRNKIRLHLLPLMRAINPNTDKSIENTALHLQQTLLVYEKAIQDTLDKIVTEDNGQFYIDIDGLKNSVSANTVLFEFLSRYGYNEQQVLQIIDSLDSEAGRKFKSQNHVLYKDRKKLVLMVDTEQCFCIEVNLTNPQKVELPDGRTLCFEFREGSAEIDKSKNIATLDADKVGDKLKVRLWKQGDFFVPFGMKGKKLLSDFMTDCKFDITRKRNQCVVCNDCALIWVVGERSDDRYRVTKETVRQLVLSVN